MTENFIEYNRKLADILVNYANEKGMWPTIDFIVQRWIEKNPEYFLSVKAGIEFDRIHLQSSTGSNESTRKGAMAMRRLVEVPERIHMLIDKLFLLEKKNYVGGEKQFWVDFGKRYPVFQLGK